MKKLFQLQVCLLLSSALIACQWWPNHHLIHPEKLPKPISAWSDDHMEHDLLIHVEWAKPPGEGPFATVIVHPEGGKTAIEMLGVIWDLAENGYLAVAVDYKRYNGEEYVRNTFPWRDEEDITRSLNIVTASSFVDTGRVAVLGFSQGGIFSLLIAAHSSPRLKTAIAYYPVTDFNRWFEKDRENLIERFVFWQIRRHFYKESGALSEQEFQKILYKASVINFVETIDVPVLLVHGDEDTSASIEESQRLKQRMDEFDKQCELYVVSGGVHIFNFRQEPQAQEAWMHTLNWLKRFLY